MDSQTPLVSVVVPVYNHEDYIQECLTSILEQDYPEIELIVINDGSTDGTEGRVRAIEERAERPIRYVAKPNEGLVRTLNLGLSLATGTYLCELASDDFLLPGSLRKRVALMQARPEIDVVACDAVVIDGERRTEERVVGGIGYDSSKHHVVDLFAGTAWILFAGILYKTSVLHRLGGYDEDFRRSSDLCVMGPLALGAHVVSVDEPLVGYRQHGSNISEGRPLWMAREWALAAEKLMPMIRDTPALAEPMRAHLYQAYIRLANKGIRHGMERGELLDVLAKARKLRPFAWKPLEYRFLRSYLGWRKSSSRHAWR